MKLAKLLIGLALSLCGTQAVAENWVTVFEQGAMSAMVDKDSIRRGADNLVYYTSESGGKGDRAADCKRRIIYTLKLYVMDGLNYPDWRNNGSKVKRRSIGEAEMQYACANA